MRGSPPTHARTQNARHVTCAARPTKSTSDFYLGRCQPAVGDARSIFIDRGIGNVCPDISPEADKQEMMHPMHSMRATHAAECIRVIPVFYGIARSVEAPYEDYMKET